MRWYLVCLGAILCTSFVHAQEPVFTASTNAHQVTSQSVFEVTFTLENTRGSDFSPPDFKGFDFVSGPSQSMSTSIINGVMTQSMSFSYSLMRIKPGRYTIGPATIRAGGKTLSSNPITIEVVEGKVREPGNTAGSDEVLLVAQISADTAYPGQQVRLDYKIYTTVNVRNYNTLSEDDYAQFYYRYVQDFNNRAQLEVLNGVQYTVQTIKSIALFPQQTGDFAIAPMVANLGIALRDERPSFIFGSRTVARTVASDSVKLKVLPLPPDAPASFTGAVGSYSMQAQVNRQQLSTDDAVVLTIRIDGDGDPKRWTPPDLSGMKTAYELYEPKILRDESVDERGAIRHQRAIEYLLIPRTPGDRTLAVEFSYFDPVIASYRTLSTPQFQLAVSQGTNTHKGGEIYTTDVASMEIRGLKPRQAYGRGVFLFTPLYFGLLFTPLIAFVAVWWMKRKEDLFEALDPVEKKRRRARKLAEKHLLGAQQNMQGDTKAYYDSISRAIFSYLSAKRNIPASELSKSNIAMHMDLLGLTQEMKDEIMQILITSEQVLYAGGTTSADRQAIYDRTLALIEQVEG